MVLCLGLIVVKIGSAQTFIQMMEFADEKVAEGDYYYALKYYQKAMEIDSNSVEVLWKYAEALRYYKDYKKAGFYYKKVYAKENAHIYPKSVYWLATMEQYNGEYEKSLEHWKLSKKVFKRDRKGFEYRKSQQAIISCLWAIKAMRDTSDFVIKTLPSPVNSEDTELAPIRYENQLWFTSLKADSVTRNEMVISESYSLQLYSAEKQDSNYINLQAIESVNEKGFNNANGSFSPDGKRFYFSRCDADFRCKIFVGRIVNGEIKDIDSLGSIINAPGKVTTMPHSTTMNGQEYLFFVSNREKSIGGLDIWMSAVSNGNQYSVPVNLGRDVNTLEDEISPFYDTIRQELYFSSSWWEGFGGMDIFKAKPVNEQFKDPENLGLPINSTKNDTYFIVDQVNNNFYFSSNREGVSFAKNPTCCNDIFTAELPIIKPPTPDETLTDLNKRLPVTLYFHNDEPNPRTKDTTTNLTYMQSFDDYVAMESKYKREYAKGLSGDKAEEAKEDIDDFFTEFVQQGVRDLSDFIRLLKIELDKGYAIEITVKGFASPLAKTDYNVNLTKRRIASLINYLYEYDQGSFKPYLDHTAANGGGLTFVQIPFGEYTADALISDNVNDKQNSVYSRKAALERKIEIQSVSFANRDTTYAEMKFDAQIHDFGGVKRGDQLSHTFTFKNTGKEILKINDVEYECGCLSYELSQTTLQPDESAKITLNWDTSSLSGKTIRNVVIKANIENRQKEIAVTAEIQE